MEMEAPGDFEEDPEEVAEIMAVVPAVEGMYVDLLNNDSMFTFLMKKTILRL